MILLRLVVNKSNEDHDWSDEAKVVIEQTMWESTHHVSERAE